MQTAKNSNNIKGNYQENNIFQGREVQIPIDLGYVQQQIIANIVSDSHPKPTETANLLLEMALKSNALGVIFALAHNSSPNYGKFEIGDTVRCRNNSGPYEYESINVKANDHTDEVPSYKIKSHHYPVNYQVVDVNVIEGEYKIKQSWTITDEKSGKVYECTVQGWVSKSDMQLETDTF